MTDDPVAWPVELRGVTETLVTTLGPNDLWNVAPLGVHAPAASGLSEATASASRPAARTWGRTRTWRNFRERGGGYVQFTRDPELFVEAALSITERDEPVLAEADAWVRVGATRVAEGTAGETDWTDWRLEALEAEVDREYVPTFNRGYAAVIEATVAASRLDVPSYDTERLRDRLEYFTGVAERAGGPAERRAIDRVRALIEE